jgi:hypothetical protein
LHTVSDCKYAMGQVAANNIESDTTIFLLILIARKIHLLRAGVVNMTTCMHALLFVCDVSSSSLSDNLGSFLQFGEFLRTIRLLSSFV